MAQPNNPFEHLTSLFNQFKIPGLNIEALTRANQDNIKAFTEAGKAVQDSMHEFGRKQNEIISEAMVASQQAASNAAGAGAKKALNPTEFAENAQAMFRKATDNTKELVEISRSGQADAMGILSRRGAEQLAELKAMATPKS